MAKQIGTEPTTVAQSFPRMSALLTPLARATAFRIALSVPSRSGEWSGIGMRWATGDSVQVAFKMSLSRNHSVGLIRLHHRDTMNTEKTKDSRDARRSPISDVLKPTPSLDFLCVHRVSVVSIRVSTE